jgi:hypothetical protein
MSSAEPGNAADTTWQHCLGFCSDTTAPSCTVNRVTCGLAVMRTAVERAQKCARVTPGLALVVGAQFSSSRGEWCYAVVDD